MSRRALRWQRRAAVGAAWAAAAGMAVLIAAAAAGLAMTLAGVAREWIDWTMNLGVACGVAAFVALIVAEAIERWLWSRE